MLAEDSVRLRHMVEAAESAKQFIAGRQRSDLDENRMPCSLAAAYHCLKKSLRSLPGSAQRFIICR